MNAFKKTVHIGDVFIYTIRKKEWVPVFVTIEYRDEKDGKLVLSLTGVEGPTNDGNAYGGCGQIAMHFEAHEEVFRPAPGYSRETVETLLAYWDRWHLNDMRAGCEHQRENWDTDKKLTIYHYKLKIEHLLAQNKLKDRVMDEVKRSGSCTPLTEEEQVLINLPYSVKSATKDELVWPSSHLLLDHYELEKTETVMAVHTRHDEFQEGLLCKPCEVCGYKLGSTWLYEQVPDEVLEFLKNLPSGTAKIPPVWAH